jgi:hypothetical protein
MAYIRIGFLGHALTLVFGPEDLVEEEEVAAGIGGGSGGSFERCVESDTDFMESEDWYEEEDRFGFG